MTGGTQNIPNKAFRTLDNYKLNDDVRQQANVFCKGVIFICQEMRNEKGQLKSYKQL